MVRGTKVLLGLLTCLLLTSALAAQTVPHLTRKNFDATVSDGKVHFIKFYAPWCGHCTRLAPTWSELYESIKGDERVSVESVDCTKERKICNKAGVGGFPTLKIFHNGKPGDKYSERRELKALQAFLNKQADELLPETSSASE